VVEKNVLLICGSVREGSVNAAVLRAASELMPSGVSSSLYSGLAELPMFNPDLDREPLAQTIIALRSAIKNASALLFSTPEYAGAMPGALKNLLEWTVGGTEISDKPVAWINPSSSPTGASKTYASLKTVLTYTGARVLNDACVSIPVPRALIMDGEITDGTVRDGIRRALMTLVSGS
jgi:chromate reductase, NAD(P)H dehydrogenase (quinone)